MKPGGYERITQMAQKVEEHLKGAFKGIDIQYLNELANSAVSDKYHLKDLRPVNSRKISLELPIYDCVVAPCTIGCPINQQIPEYVSLVGEKNMMKLLK